MGKTYLLNAFSINMLPGRCRVEFVPISVSTAAGLLSPSHFSEGPINAIGHPETDACVRNLLESGGMAPLPVGKRENVCIMWEDFCVVAQYSGPRLPEGATILPSGAIIEFWMVQILPEEI